MKNKWNLLLILSLIGFLIFAGLFIREKNIQIAKTDALVKQSIEQSPPPGGLPPKPANVEKPSSMPGIEYEIAAGACLLITVAALIGRRSARSKGEHGR
ncbi:hypothetical protein [Lihuaxuella thermophila]|uniref:Uncharacterized protein n=1 Tax=Lihuaxuella thermophila TaxID=1173111 RepID=A0A1H8G5W4_9BACL|nr:hypothetical protein [Lihuaxuella thermophila]SEN39140.1 hypothetical protein SAMN05444955_11081 [Lihuaxuella thermophila]